VGLSDGHFQQMSYVNCINTSKGGQHVNHVADLVSKVCIDAHSSLSLSLSHVNHTQSPSIYTLHKNTRTHQHLLAALSKKKKSASNVKPHHIKNHMWLFVNALIANPAFDSQTKVNLTSKKSSFHVKCDFSPQFVKKIAKVGIIENVLSWANFKQNKELKKNDGKKKSRISGIPKLDDANEAGGRNAHKCTLILTEGDSAKALAVSGLSVIGRDYYGVFPLKGKLLNVREATHKTIMNNDEISALKKILGLQQSKEV
jgi:DNA topoisomerase-2